VGELDGGEKGGVNGNLLVSVVVMYLSESGHSLPS